jgi:hypothetical protein
MCVLQRRNAEQEAHDSLVTQNQGLEREYQRFEKKQKLMKSIQVRKTRTGMGRLLLAGCGHLRSICC